MQLHVYESVVCIAACLSLAGCDSHSANALTKRCDSLYEALDSEISNAIMTFEGGTSPDAVYERYTSRIERIARDVPALRGDLARGGEKHRWPWPDFVMAESILNYETTIGEGILGWNPSRLNEPAETLMEEAETMAFLPEELERLAQVERGSFQDLKWFCNRVVAATLPRVQPTGDQGLVFQFMRREMSAKRLEIMRAIETEEELIAFTVYLDSLSPGLR